MEIGYYPGCALHGSSNDYEASVRACFERLDVNVRELDDWICCGATAAHSMSQRLSTALPARNLAIAERDGIEEVLAPCPMCSMELIKAAGAIADSKTVREEMSEIVELPVTGSTSVINLIEIFHRVGAEKIAEAASATLEEYKPACYYGCLLTRPAKIVQFDDCEHPTSMETLLSALGAAPVEWNYKTECCGAGMTLANTETVLSLSNKILDNAVSHGANCIVVACPMCHVNLDMKQADIEARFETKYGMPVYYLSDLIGIALGVSKKTLGVTRHFAAKDVSN